MKRGYLQGKILPWGTPKNHEKDLDSANGKRYENETEDKKKYYDKKVDDLINPEKEKNNLYHSGKVFFRRGISTNENESDENNNKNDLKISEFKITDYYDFDKS